jgi:phosphate/sulfate permease
VGPTGGRERFANPGGEILTSENPTLDRLEDQLRWYSKKSRQNQRCFKWLKVIEIVAAALIPFAAGFWSDARIAGVLGVIVVILESIQGLYQFQQNWTSYRSTTEGLKHEKFLWEAKAGPYKDLDNPTLEALFAERVEALISTEHAKWVSYQEQAGKGKGQKN